MHRLKHPLAQATIVMVAAYLVFAFGIRYVPPLFGIRSAPVPSSVLLQYMATALVGVLLWVSDNEARWREFKRPIRETMVRDDRRTMRRVFMVLVPVLVGLVTFSQVRPTVAAPSGLRSIHPAPPSTITFRGQTLTLDGLENPLRADGSIAEDHERGKVIYYRNCMPCHGDALDGAGNFAHGLNPAPIDLTGTLRDLTESYVFWRIAKGGPGLPIEGAPWHSAMPVWEDYLTEEEIWSVVVFLYEQTELPPRTWEHAGAEGEEH